MDLNYKKIKEGESWGEKWESAWFHLTGEVPKNWLGKQVATDLDFSGEGLVFNSEGVAIQGITNGAIWDPNLATKRSELAAAGINPNGSGKNLSAASNAPCPLTSWK